MSQSFLALQGTASHFFGQLSAALGDRGHSVQRINFCGGDLLYAGELKSTDCTVSPADLPAYYYQLLKVGGFSDILLFGDCRAIHLPIHKIAPVFGARVHVFEEGYVRPYWLTLERYGVNGRSRLPRDPAWYLEHRTLTPPPAGLPTGYNLYERAWHDIRYRMGNAFYASRFPGFRSHRPFNGALEYAGLAKRFAHQKRHRTAAALATSRLIGSKRPYYLFPLQLNSDSQIVVHSPFEGVCDAIEHVMQSFARHAQPDAMIVIKNHPLDTGIVDYRRYACEQATLLGMADRVVFLEDGHLPTLLDHARGVVVVNSTVGLSALHHRRPLIALGCAIYDMPGMTWQGSLDDFWTQAEGPDMRLYYAFLDYIIHNTQINGDFYTRSGIAMATVGAVAKLEAAVHG